ncbi:MAG: serine protein kinase RIO [Candidatus Kariarchaeaceae archaeon]|jgi:RIO kinase 1
MIKMSPDPEYQDEYDDHLEDTYSRRVAKLDEKADAQRVRDKEDNDLKVVETVFDNKTRMILMSLRGKGYFYELGGAISTGKEANVYFALARPEARAIKIFRIDVTSFKKMRPYIEGDHRFKRFRSSRSGFIETWARKEFKNLMRLQEHGIPSPEPLIVERNILIMEYLGTEDAVLPRLKDVEVTRPAKLYKEIMASVRDMYQKAQLVHADLSEFNILFDVETEKYYIIDVSQAVLWDHPKAEEFLLRDLYNVNRYFSQYGVELIDLRRLYKWIAEEDVNEVLLSEIEKK